MTDIELALKKEKLTKTEQIKLVLKLSLPAIMAELTSIAMQYIDAGMVGKLGANEMAAIGLVSSTTWLIGGMCHGVSAGFSVQVAQLIGARCDKEAAKVFRQAITTLLLFSVIISIVASSISGSLPVWLGGEKEVVTDSARYFLIFSLTIPVAQLRYLGSSMLQCSGNMKTPSLLNSLVCILDVIFNMLFIFPTRNVEIFGWSFKMWGAGLGVCGAAFGTSVAEVIIAICMMYMACRKSEKLRIRRQDSFRWSKRILKNAIKIGVPMTIDHIFMCCAYIAGTVLVAPLGSVAVAANSLAITAESLCYMPGYGIGSAATTLTGQGLGAGRLKLVKSFAWISVTLGMTFMGLMAIVMYCFAPDIFSLLTTDIDTASLSAQIIRIELWAEPLYGASIVCQGAFRGAGDTLLPSIMNLLSMWGVRIVLAAILIPYYGLAGYWIAMCIELIFRGSIFIVRMISMRWIKKAVRL